MSLEQTVSRHAHGNLEADLRAALQRAGKISTRRGAVSFRQASASKLPFAEASFDGATMIPDGMNIADKKAAFAEVRPVLKRDGEFVIWDALRQSDGAFADPVPWSSEPATNHIAASETYRAALREAGFTVESERNRRDFALRW
jgi:ubiquinone/menaquinone biosynthesis C-methylase UbiE